MKSYEGSFHGELGARLTSRNHKRIKKSINFLVQVKEISYLLIKLLHLWPKSYHATIQMKPLWQNVSIVGFYNEKFEVKYSRLSDTSIRWTPL